MELNALSDFDAIVRNGGFGAASRATGRPKATLSRHVSQLERDLGVQLLRRAGSVVEPTEEGAFLYAHVARLLADLQDVTDAVSKYSQNPAGRLRVSVPALFAYEAVGRISAMFIAQYPEVQLQVVTEDRQVDCIAGDYDVVIRANPTPDPALVGRCVLHDALVMVAAPSLKKPPVDGSEAVPVPAIVLLSTPDDKVWRVRDAHEERAFRPQAVARFSSISMLYDAVLAGAGATVLPSRRARDAIADGVLANWGTMTDLSMDVWALYSARRQSNPRIGVFVDFLVAHFAREAPPLTSQSEPQSEPQPQPQSEPQSQSQSEPQPQPQPQPQATSAA